MRTPATPARRRSIAVGGAIAMAAALLPLAPASATPPDCSNFDSQSQGSATGLMQCVVPAGATALRVVLTGAGGGGAGGVSTSSGGSGAIVTAVIPVTPGAILDLEVGTGGGAGTSDDGAGGGGWTAVLSSSVLLAAAGGGGGAGSRGAGGGYTDSVAGGSAALGATADAGYGEPTPATTAFPGDNIGGGGGGTTLAGGTAGAGAGGAGGAGIFGAGGGGGGACGFGGAVGGNRWQGGAGGSGQCGASGGGGGAGINGGGGGGATYGAPVAGGGGGGGASFAPPGATYASAGNGGGSNGATATAGGDGRAVVTVVVLPGAPSALVATPGDGQASIAFTPGTPGTSPTTNYEYTLDNGSTWVAFSPAVTASPVTIPNLTNGTAYSVKLRAVSADGTSEWSSAVPVTPQPSGQVPSAPTTPTILAGNGKVTVSVSRGIGGGTPTGFIVLASPGSGLCTIMSATGGSCTVTGLANGTRYTFTAIATNAQGPSDPSSASEPAQPGSVKRTSAQSVPSRLGAGQSSLAVGGSSTPVAVDPNSRANGLDIAGDSFDMSLDGLGPDGRPLNLGPNGVLRLASERDVRTSGNGFLPGSTVSIYVDPPVSTTRSRAKGAIFVGTLEVASDGTFDGTATLPDSIGVGVHDLQAVGVTRGNLLRVLTLGVEVLAGPGKVRDLRVTATTTSGTAVVAWRKPAGTAPVDGYVLSYRATGLNGWMSIRTTAPSATVRGLVVGCSYDVRVRAVNRFGRGPAAFTQAVITGGLRAAPRGDLRCRVS